MRKGNIVVGFLQDSIGPDPAYADLKRDSTRLLFFKVLIKIGT